MKKLFAATAAAVLLGTVTFCFCAAMAQDPPPPPPPPPPPQPQPQPQPQQPKAEEKKDSPRKVLKNFYMEDDEKTKSFTYKDSPPFKLYKPNDNWHFIDVTKLHGAEAQKIKDPKEREKVDNFYKACKCIMYNEELNAEARVLVGVGLGNKTLDVIFKEMKHNLSLSVKDYKELSAKGKKKSGAQGFKFVFEGKTSAGEKEVYTWYLFVKNNSFYQLRIACPEEKNKDKKVQKELEKIYSKWKF